MIKVEFKKIEGDAVQRWAEACGLVESPSVSRAYTIEFGFACVGLIYKVDTWNEGSYHRVLIPGRQGLQGRTVNDAKRVASDAITDMVVTALDRGSIADADALAD